MWVSTGRNPEWYTPPNIFDALGETFDLDPCSPGRDKCFVPADRAYTVSDDGLTQSWDGFVWLNPPYGRGMQPWVERMLNHNNGIMLVLARTDSRWFQRAAQQASSICLMASRVRFYVESTVTQSSNNAGTGSVLFGFGARADRALERAGLGVVLQQAKPHLGRP